jgi:hypothetical protein
MPDRPDNMDLFWAWLCFLGSCFMAASVAAAPEATMGYVIWLVNCIGSGFFWQRFWTTRDKWRNWQKAREDERTEEESS